jgi:hypothetical protein
MTMAEAAGHLAPNTQDMRRHLELLFGHAREYDDGLIEIAINTGHGWLGQLFGVDAMDQAVSYAAQQNAAGRNAYVGVALRDPDTPPFGRASDSDHYATTAVGGDLDTKAASAAAPERTLHLPPTFVVCTGNDPHTRLQLFWLLQEPVTDPEQHRQLFGGLADMLDGDRSITNPGRIMRLAGSVAWPTKKDRVPEMTSLRPVKDPNRRYAAEAIAKAYPNQQKVHDFDPSHKNDPIDRVGAKNGLGLDTGKIEDGREAYMHRTVMAVFFELVGTTGAMPTVQELFDAAWPQYEKGVVVSVPGKNTRGPDECLRKCAYIIRRFEAGRLRDTHGTFYRTLEQIVAAYEAKAKAKAKQAHTTSDFSAAGGSGMPAYKIKTASFLELLDDNEPDPPEYIEPNFLGPGNFGLIAGPPKSQKSFLLTEMLVACATGGSFLGGAFTVPKPLKVFYLQAEMGRKLLKKRFKMRTFLTPEQRSLLGQNMIVTERFHMLLDEAGVAMAAEIIRDRFPDGPDIIAIDPLANLFDGESEDKAPEVMAFLTQRVDALRRMVNPTAAILMVHHSSKKNVDDMNRDPFVAIRGSGALRGYYDTGIVIFRKSEEGPERRVFFECRNGESPEPVTISLNDRGTFDVVDTSSAGLSPSMAQVILDEIRAAWNAGKPLSNAKQTKSEGRHVGRFMAGRHGMISEAVDALVQQWVDNGTVSVEMCDRKTKMKGLKVTGFINAEVG